MGRAWIGKNRKSMIALRRFLARECGIVFVTSANRGAAVVAELPGLHMVLPTTPSGAAGVPPFCWGGAWSMPADAHGLLAILSGRTPKMDEASLIFSRARIPHAYRMVAGGYGRRGLLMRCLLSRPPDIFYNKTGFLTRFLGKPRAGHGLLLSRNAGDPVP